MYENGKPLIKHFTDKKNYFDLNYNGKEKDLKASFYYTNRTFKSLVEHDGSSEEDNYNYEADAVSFDLQKVFSLREDRDVLVVGVSGNHNTYKDLYDNNSHIDGQRNTMGIYGQYTYAASDKVDLSFGVREKFIGDSLNNISVFILQVSALYKMNFVNILINATSEKELKSHKINGGAFINIGLDINYAKTLNDHWTGQLGISLSNPEA